MTKDQYLDILMLLSALESWSFSTKNYLSDHMLDELNRIVEQLREEVLK